MSDNTDPIKDAMAMFASSMASTRYYWEAFIVAFPEEANEVSRRMTPALALAVGFSTQALQHVPASTEGLVMDGIASRFRDADPAEDRRRPEVKRAFAAALASTVFSGRGFINTTAAPERKDAVKHVIALFRPLAERYLLESIAATTQDDVAVQLAGLYTALKMAPDGT